MDSSAISTTAVQTIKTSSEPVHLAYGASFSEDAAAFEASLQTARTKFGMETDSVGELAKAAMRPLEHIDAEAQSLSDYASTAVESDNELTPGEIVNLTVQSHKFLFHSQLTANVANRSADGIQQLFRQQG